MTFQGYDLATQSYPPVLPASFPSFGSTPFLISRGPNQIEIGWSVPTEITPTDYNIEFKESSSGVWLSFTDGVSTNTTATITSLIDLTSYDFRVRATNGTAFTQWSGVLAASTTSNVPFFTDAYSYFNVAGAPSVALGARANGTVIRRNGTTVATLSQGQVSTVTSSIGDVFTSDDPFIANGTSGNNTLALPNVLSAGTQFSYIANRNNPQTLYYHAFQAGSIEMRNGNTVLDSDTYTADSSGTLSANFIGNIQIISTGLVVVYASSNNFVDARLVLPDSSELLGIPSSFGELSTLSPSSIVVNATYSNSTTETFSYNNTTAPRVDPVGTSNLYQGEVGLFKSVNGEAFAGASVADSNGTASAAFQPTSIVQSNFMITETSDYVAFGSLTPGTIDVIDASGTVLTTLVLSRTGGSTTAPYKARENSRPAGTRYVSTTPVVAWWQPTATDDETVLLGID